VVSKDPEFITEAVRAPAAGAPTKGIDMSHPHHTHSHEASVATRGQLIRWATHYDRVISLFTLGREAAFRNRIVEASALVAGERVLDVGCGTGTLALSAAARVGKDGRVVGIDPSSEMVERARKKANGLDEAVAASLSFQVAAVENLPFDDESFDVVLSTLVFHHLPGEEQRAGLCEIRRVLRRGGRLFIVDFEGRGPALHRWLGRLLHRHEEGETPHGHDLGRVATLAAESGFDQVDLSGFRPRFLRQLSARAA
jgi:demethylmenaquinone methyltransferase/2-methoxy-6-polyprenyl-1,4-benzoquinol methylase/phosphoethanolamine N-methyltransferase